MSTTNRKRQGFPVFIDNDGMVLRVDPNQPRNPLFQEYDFDIKPLDEYFGTYRWYIPGTDDDPAYVSDNKWL